MTDVLMPSTAIQLGTQQPVKLPERPVEGSNGLLVDLNNLPDAPTHQHMEVLVEYIDQLEEALRQATAKAEDNAPALSAPARAPRGRKRKVLDADFEGEDSMKGDDDEEEYASEEVKRPKKKAKKATADVAEAAVISAPKVAAVPPKILKAKLKSLLTHFKSKVKAEKFFTGYDATVRELTAEDAFTLEEFNAAFPMYVGKQTQPTPENNPKSSVIIRELSQEDLQTIFGDEITKLTCTVWNKGGKPTHGYGGFGGFGGLFGGRLGRGGGGFSKGSRVGSAPLRLLNAKMTYSTKGLKLSLKVSCTNGSASSAGGGDYDGFESDDY